MLTHLSISDLAIVRKLNLELRPGMSALTGETGAGKSILLTALGLALGERADSNLVRPGSERAEVNLEFDLGHAPAARQWLLDNELDDDQDCLIRRTVNQDGRSKAYINNRPVTLQILQRLGSRLIEIHGQHAHLTLLQANEQRRLLDDFGNHQALLGQVNKLYADWRDTQQELEILQAQLANTTEQEELLTFQIQELEQLDLENFNYQEIFEEHHRQANLGHVLTQGQAQLDVLYDSEQVSVYQLLGQSIQAFSELDQYSTQFQEMTSLLADAQIQVNEAVQQLRRFLDQQQIDPQKLDHLEQQLASLHDLGRKHQVKPEELPQLAEGLKKRLANITHDAEQIDQLQAKLASLSTEYFTNAQQLSDQRANQANQLQENITTNIKELGMPQGLVQINIATSSEKIPQLNGLDKVEFLIQANPGLPPRPLAKVASGGELSRISLAIQVSTCSEKTTPTMIFDEVDSGIGGGIAEIVGQQLRELGTNRQILCVTHLAQVASQAHHHLLVEKNQQNNISSSNVKELSAAERTPEIARMLGGVTITENTLAHAEEMLQWRKQ